MICPNCNKEVIMQPECNINGLDQVRCPECGITYSQITLKDNTDWNSIRTQAAIAAIQGFIKHSKNEFDSVEDAIKWMKIVSHNSITMADALIAELKKGE